MNAVTMQQHGAVVEDVLGRHLLWCPTIIDCLPIVWQPTKTTMLRLNDGRECQIVTRMEKHGEDLYRIETEVGKWRSRLRQL